MSSHKNYVRRTFADLLGFIRYLNYRRRSQHSGQRHVFVVGAPRSGTSLMQVLLARHSKFVAIDSETGFFSPKFILNRAHHWSGERKEIIDLCDARNLVDLFDQFACRLKEKRDEVDSIFVEKTPLHVLQLRFIVSCFPNSQFLNMIRDPRDCFASSINHPNIRKDATQFGRYWKKCIQRRLIAGDDERIRDVFYHEFVTSPEAQLKSVMKFLDFPFEPRQLIPDMNRPDERSNRREFARLNQPVTAASLGKFKSRLTTSQIGAVERNVGEYLRYSLNPEEFRSALRNRVANNINEAS